MNDDPTKEDRRARRRRMENCLSILGSQQAQLAKTSGQTKQQIHAWMASAGDHACSKFALSCRMAGLTVTGDWIAYEYGTHPSKQTPRSQFSWPNSSSFVIER